MRILQLVLCAFAFSCVACGADTYIPIDMSELRKAVSDTRKLEELGGKEITVQGVIHGYASGSIYLDLRQNALDFVGTKDENPPVDKCIGLVAPESLFGRIRGAHVLKISGSTFLFENPTELSGAAYYKGIRFYPNCGYFSRKALYILVEKAELEEGQEEE